MEKNLLKTLALPIFGAILCIGLISSAFIVVHGLESIKNKENSISITGSAKKQFKSDFVIWRGTYSAQSANLPQAYAALKAETVKVKSYLNGKGIKDADLVFSSINTVPSYVILPNGQQSSKIESYRLVETVQVNSKNVDGITNISRQSTELINQGIDFQSNAPEYYYTKLADLKIDMLSLATKDAMTRAQQIAKTTGGTIGKLRSARMGVFQITPLYSTDVSDSGIYDNSSINKEITGVMTCEFEIK